MGGNFREHEALSDPGTSMYRLQFSKALAAYMLHPNPDNQHAKHTCRPRDEIERFKARYVAKGFEHVYGVDFFETWAPIGRYATLRALLSICVVWDLET